MSSTDCEKIRPSLWRYVDRELPARELGAISGHLRACADCLDAYEERARQVKLCRLAFEGTSFGESFVERFRKRFAEDGPAAPRQVASSFSGRHQIVQWAAVAAILIILPLLVFVGIYSGKPDVLTLGSFHVSKLQATFRVEGATTGREYRAPATEPLRPGTWFGVPIGGALEIALLDEDGSPGADLEIAGPASILIPSDVTRKSFHAELRLGQLHARVEKLGADESFVIETPDALARVVGTQFDLEVADGDTRLRVEEGVVSFASSATGTTAKVGSDSGWYRVAKSGVGPQPFDPAGGEAQTAGAGAGPASGPEAGSSRNPSQEPPPVRDTGTPAPAGSPRPDLDNPVSAGKKD